ncbi:hypothetical protein [Vitiosangium sp. GDMCC 1.1324]|uniref:hypothetical protein n=1 Tax=Vitiosangium sp. (strain GDMCC 1.1324) TaxID=2138576 RepID=UPI000D3574D5|nr:hypothetical protein [Vitiosangium sp. GDMCC 1.1324]PTL83742.1 hypothetical protein DAT35_09715 [Vitiosangium sp. GDMCC 1.1324]
MGVGTTVQALASITDEGLFERLATAILREASPLYASLAHPGVNAAGRTVKAPLDGICFIPGSAPPHLIAVHHTITACKDLEKKWLHDPATVTPRKGPRPNAPPGDVVKTATILAEERKRTPDLRATLVLTTNEEPGEALIRTVEAAARARGIEIDLWSRSRLAHFLDHRPAGQWLRRSFLQIEQELLSPELLHELSRKSLEVHRPPDNAKAWIPRALDTTLEHALRRNVSFLVAGSGLGKSVACHRKLAAHVEAGGFGIVVPHDVVASALTLDQAVTMALRQLHPFRVTVEEATSSLWSPERPLLVVVEDINRSGQTQALVEKIAGWSQSQAAAKGQDGSASHLRLVCPLWPEVLASLEAQTRKRIEPLLVFGGGFSAREGREAVLARARLAGRELSALSAESISRALGHDPLLIALHDFGATPEPERVIGQFVDAALARTAAAERDYPAADYLDALRALAGEMLARREIELVWRQVKGWAGVQGDRLHLLGRLAHEGTLLRLTGPSAAQRLSFRHDRVRDWLLTDAVADLESQNLLQQDVVAEPYFAEVMGAVLASRQTKPSFLESVAEANPLALFHALRLFGEPSLPHHRAVVQALDRWLESPSIHELANRHLRQEALAALAETDSRRVPELVRKLRERTLNGYLARLRNGDLSGGIELCIELEPGTSAPWRDIQIEHAKLRFGAKLGTVLAEFLRREDLDAPARIGALRLAGHIGDPSLAYAVEVCWNADAERGGHLADYLWAFGQCCEDDPARFLGPVCDAWAALSDEEKEDLPSPRDDLAADHLRWAFRRWPPVAALDYFVQRGRQDELRWPITYMLHSIDHPTAVLFVVQELASIQRSLEGTDSFSHFVSSASDEWRRAQSALDLHTLWDACNNQGWFATRRELLDGRLQPPFTAYLWDAARPADELDKMAAEQRPSWIDNFLKTDVLWSEVLGTLVAWLDARRSLTALQIVAMALKYRGTREDLRLLRIYEGMPEEVARQLITDAEFAVRRRTIH